MAIFILFFTLVTIFFAFIATKLINGFGKIYAENEENEIEVVIEEEDTGDIVVGEVETVVEIDEDNN